MTFHPELMARSALTRMENLGGPPFPWTKAEESFADYAKGMTKPQLGAVIAYLAARVLVAEEDQ